MVELERCFDCSKQEVVSVIGSGGKSSLINYLAKAYPNEKVLVSTTTKMLMPKNEEYDILWLNPCCSDEKIVAKTNGSLTKELGEQLKKQSIVLKPENKKGIVVAGDETLEDGVSKLQMPKNTEFYKSFSRFDKVLLESDGSGGLPLKGWNDFEPVILNGTTMTIGVLPISAIGKPVTKDYIHRLPLWLKLMEEQEETLMFNRQLDKTISKGEERWVTKEDFVQVVANENGLWKKARGNKVLYISQVETKEQLNLAKEIVKMLPTDCKSQLTKIIAGSVKERKGVAF